MTTNTAPVLAFIEYLEDEARTLSTTAGERRDLAEQLRTSFNLPSIATPPAPTVAPAAAQTARRVPAAPAPVIAPGAMQFRTRILTELESGPKRSLQMKPKGLPTRDEVYWAKTLRTLLQEGAITVKGNRAGATYTLVAKKGSAPASPAKPTAAPTGEWPSGPIYSIVRQAIAQSTAGALDRRELLEAARRHNAGFEFTHVDNAVKALLSMRLLVQTSSSTGDRFSLARRG